MYVPFTSCVYWVTTWRRFGDDTVLDIMLENSEEQQLGIDCLASMIPLQKDTDNKYSSTPNYMLQRTVSQEMSRKKQKQSS